MADTTANNNTGTGAGATVNAGHLGGDTPAAFANQKNKAPADQPGFDASDAKWAGQPGAGARANKYPRHDG